jgi:methylisocitrate lyase
VETDRRQKEDVATFIELARRPGITVIPGIASALTARIAEDVGFECIGLGGYALGAELGIPEPLLSLEDVAGAVRRIADVTNIPLLVDAGAGWGEPLHVTRTVRVLERAGAGAIHIEDQWFPKRAHYHRGVEHIIPADEMAMKIEAAVEARASDAFAIVARTDAMATDSFEEGIRRADAYFRAGADCVMCFPNNAREAERAPRELHGVPLIYVNSDGNRSGRAVLPSRRLEEWGWRFVFDAITTTNVVSEAVHDVLVRLARTGETERDQEKARKTRASVEDRLGLEACYAIESSTVER